MNEKISKKVKGVRSHDSRIVKIRTEGKGVGVLKTGIAALFILAQLAFLILIYLGLVYSINWYLILSMVLSGICILHVLSSRKTGATKAIWVLFLAACSSFGYIGYFMSSEAIFFGYAKRRYKRIFARTASFNGENSLSDNLPLTVKRDAEFLWNAGNFKTYNNSCLKYYTSGAYLFDDVIETLGKAEKFIFIEFFIISDGLLFNRIFDILAEKVKNGVDVRIIADGIGSHGTLSFKARKKLKKAGIKLRFFNRIQPHFTFALNLRDHRKIMVIDGKTAFTGGCNLADEYINVKRMYGYWKDTGLKVEGCAVDGLTLSFLRQWEFVTRQEEDYSRFLNLYEEKASDFAVIPYADGKDYKDDIGKGVYDNMISGAQEKLYIMTPYFVPDEQTFNAIATKALSGVDVRLVIPGVPDKLYVYFVTKDNAERLAKLGVKVYIMRHAFVHSKLMLTENCASVGSVNIDLRSYYNQFENGVYTNDAVALKDISADFEKTFRASDIIDKNVARKNVFARMTASFLRLFSPLM